MMRRGMAAAVPFNVWANGKDEWGIPALPGAWVGR